MSQSISRRNFLRIAGGVTFLGLTPVARGVFAATDAAGSGLPLFTAVPYIQPGNGSKLVQGKEATIVAWQTENKPADFKLVYGLSKNYGKQAKINLNSRLSEAETRLNYAATLENLPLGKQVFYKVTGNGKTIAEGYFTTRQPRGTRTRFVAIGDNCCKNVGNRNVAYQAYLTHPDFVMNVGDSVYNQGLNKEYTEYFFTVFNSDKAEMGLGAPLLRSIPYYSVLGNHDIHFRDPETRNRVADFDVDPGALGYYTNMHLPSNGFELASHVTPTRGAKASLESFHKAAGWRYPQMANYSFDHGDVHFLCLDSNLYIDPTNSEYQKWIENDLKQTDARWKFVIYHHPAFNVGDTHYTQQHMRALSPLLEKCGVDLVVNGHEHIYQRCRPLHFAPRDLTKASDVHRSNRLIPGKFTVDHEFDGVKVTKPKGIIYITSGAGGQNLYNPEQNNSPESWLHKRDDNVAYVARLVSDRHSFTLFDVNGDELTFTQLDDKGDVIEKIRVTKA